MSNSSGRPPKFNEPRRPITVTLPDRILRQLDALGDDRALAIVKATEAVAGQSRSGLKKVDLVEVAPGVAVIVVGPCASLRRIEWLRLVETAPGRNLLIIPSGLAVDSLEVAIMDLLEKAPDIHDEERSLLNELRNKLGSLRRERRISKAEIIFFDTRNLTPSPKEAPESLSRPAPPPLSQLKGDRAVQPRKHYDKKQLGKRITGQATRLLLGGALLFLAACSGSSSTGSDASSSLTVTPGANPRVAVKGPGGMSFTGPFSAAC